MPSEATHSALSGRCYCGAVTFQTRRPPLTVAYCHCADCRRWTGSPVSAFAAFGVADVVATPDFGKRISVNPGVERWFCPDCGAPIAAKYDYLPGQIYVSVGLFDDPSQLPPQMHAHAEQAVTWLHLEDGLPRSTGSARAALNATREG